MIRVGLVFYHNRHGAIENKVERIAVVTHPQHNGLGLVNLPLTVAQKAFNVGYCLQYLGFYHPEALTIYSNELRPILPQINPFQQQGIGNIPQKNQVLC